MTDVRTRTDRYPSRVGADQRITDRLDPVLWGGPDRPGPLAREQLLAFERDGYLLLEDWIDTETIERCLAAIDRLGRAPATRDSERAVLEPDAPVVRSLFEVHKVDDTCAAIAADERLAGVARQLVDDDVYIHQSRINLKPALHGRSFNWHSDFETWHVEDGMPAMRAVSCSIALTANHVWNGPLLLIGGSHTRYVSFGGTTPEGNYKTSLRQQEYGVPDLEALAELHSRGDIATFTGPAGSVAFFDCNVMHGSPNNISPQSRTNAFFVYNAWGNRLEQPFGVATHRPSHVADRAPERPI